MKLFLQKKCKIFDRWGLRPQTPVPPAAGGFASKSPASGGWGLRPQTPIGLRRLGALPPDPQNSPPLRISGYAPGRPWGVAAQSWATAPATLTEKRAMKKEEDELFVVMLHWLA